MPIAEKNGKQYSQNIQKLQKDIYDELTKNVSDGMVSKLMLIDDTDAVYDFLKNQGYEFKYQEFVQYLEESNMYVHENITEIERYANTGESAYGELSDDDLEQVSGGGILGELANDFVSETVRGISSTFTGQDSGGMSGGNDQSISGKAGYLHGRIVGGIGLIGMTLLQKTLE